MKWPGRFPPGSPEARAVGCKCPEQDEPLAMTDGVWWRIAFDCPIHLTPVPDEGETEGER